MRNVVSPYSTVLSSPTTTTIAAMIPLARPERRLVVGLLIAREITAAWEIGTRRSRKLYKVADGVIVAKSKEEKILCVWLVYLYNTCNDIIERVTTDIYFRGTDSVLALQNFADQISNGF